MEATYLTKQLSDFAGGRRRSDVMAPIAAELDPDDIQSLSVYFSRQPRPQGGGRTTTPHPGRQLYEEGNAESGVRACATCHQLNGGGNLRSPRLAGQHAAYVIRQLSDFRSGRRANDREMVEVAKRLTPAEIRELAEYIAGL